MLLGISLIPVLSLQLLPSSRSNDLSVSFSWDNAGPELLEMEVTTKLEGALARTRGLREIVSETGNGWGTIRLSIDKEENIDAIKLYLGSVVRSVKSGFPEGVQVSEVRGGEYSSGKEAKKERQLLLTYGISGPGTTQDVSRFAEDNISNIVSTMPGIESVTVTGAVPMEWVLIYDQQVLENIGISASDICSALNNYYMRRDGGKVLIDTVPAKEYAYIIFRGNPLSHEIDMLNMPIKTLGDRIVLLKDIATLDYREKSPSSYYRINGLNQLNINIFAEKNANVIDLSAKVRGKMDLLEKDFGGKYSLQMAYDASKELEDELNQTLFRTLLTILILLIFVFLVSRDFRYLLIIAVSLAANVLIAFVFYYFLKVEIHIYTLAGITVSFGIIIDNVIVMADHYRHHRDRKVFMAILAATLTTMGALTVIFNMDNEIMRNMWDFTTVIIVNLSVSLFVALFFVPALMEKIPLRKKEARVRVARKRKVVKFTWKYKRFIGFTWRFRKAWVILAILGFGLPVFMIPSSVDRDKSYAETYNRIFSSEWFLTIRPWMDKLLGGSLRLFVEGGKGEWRQNDNNDRIRTSLSVVMTMPHGAMLEQMNEAFMKVENFVSGFQEVDLFTTSISSANEGRMKITFKEEAEMTGFPEMLKNELVRYCNSIGNADSQISGVGRSFSNSLGDGYRSEGLKVVGYNYRQVMKYAEVLKNKLSENRRVKKLYIGNARNPEKMREFVVKVDKAKLARNNSNVNDIMWRLRSLSYARDEYTTAYIDNEQTSIVIRPKNTVETSIWEMQNYPVQGDKATFRLSDVGTIQYEDTFDKITKTNQEYDVSVQYDFIGDYMLSNKVKERVMKEMNQSMPIGFRVKEGRDYWGGYWKMSNGFDRRILYILLVFCIIYFICAILLESLKQAMIVMLIVPLSFIGCFLGFYCFGLVFNEGGLAAFILMCGLSVNAVLYIQNDYNNKIIAGKARGLQTYLSAWNAKIIPILLTVISTILGFIPFLIGSNVADFWISLAIGTMSGLIFSVLVLMIYLPLFFMRKEDKAGCRRKNSGMKEGGRKWLSHIELNKIRGFIKH